VCRESADQQARPRVRLSVYVQARAARTETAGQHGGDLKIRLAAAPLDNAANEALVAFVALRLEVPKRNVRILGGGASRRKTLEIEGASAAALALLCTAAPPGATQRRRASGVAAKKRTVRGPR
jgi:uncharacterized protein YggU (UPF0235/DUF167 family)